MINQRRLLTSAALVALCAFAAPALALAQESQTDQLGEVVVTGARNLGLNAPTDSGVLGDKPILDTPFSVTVIGAEEIAQRQPASMAQLFVKDPAVFSFATAGTVNWWGTQIRGLGVRNYYVDDIPVPLYWGGDFPLEPIESVQALKGATGFMYGFGAPGGAILYRTKRPTETPMLTAEAGVRGKSVVSAQIDAGGPVDAVDGLGFRINIAKAQGEEYNEAEIDRSVASLALDYRISDALTWSANLGYEEYSIDGEPFHVYWTKPAGTPLPAVPTDYDFLNVDNSTYAYRTQTNATTLAWQVNDAWKVSLTGGYTLKRHFSNKMFIELNSSAGDYDAYNYQFGETDKARFGQLLAQGSLDTGPVRHEIVAGAMSQYVRSTFGFNAYDYAFTGNIFTANNYVLPGTPNYADVGSPFQERQQAIFASDTLHIGDHWQVLAGLRNTSYDIDDVDADPATVGYSTSETTPTIAVLYKPQERTTFYASYVESLEGGSVVSDPKYNNIGEVLPATVSLQYEAGVKHDGQRWDLTAAAFRIEQVAQIDTDIGGGLINLTQDGLTVYNGVEVSGEYRLNEQFSIGGGAVVLDATYEKNTDPTLVGTVPPEVAKYQLVGSLSYDAPSIPGLSFHTTARYFGDVETFAPTTQIPGYTLVSAGAEYRTRLGGRDVTFTGNVNNLFNKKYWGLQNFGEAINGSLGVKVGW